MNEALKLLSSMVSREADAALIISNENRRYFTGFVSSLGYLLVTKEEAYLFVDFRYAEAAREQASGCEVISFTSLSESLGDVISAGGVKSIMLEGSAFTLNEAERIDSILGKYGAESIKGSGLDKIISKMRIVKTSSETEKIMKAQRITEKALADTLKLVREGVREKDIALELEYLMRRGGAEGVSFDLIVISGEKTSMPHGVPGDRTFRRGDFITFDIGATYKGYHSDMTRTYALGEVNQKQKRVYATVLDAQKRALEAVHGGALCSEVDAAARDHIYQAGYEGFFGHSTGHGVGLEIHEAPAVSSRSDTVLQSGMVITIEPGIYIPGEFGVRIEDMVVVTGDGYINLAAASKELTIL